MFVSPQLRRLVRDIQVTLAVSARSSETQRLIGAALRQARLEDRSNRRHDAPASRWVRRYVSDLHVQNRIRIP